MWSIISIPVYLSEGKKILIRKDCTPVVTAVLTSTKVNEISTKTLHDQTTKRQWQENFKGSKREAIIIVQKILNKINSWLLIRNNGGQKLAWWYTTRKKNTINYEFY